IKNDCKELLNDFNELFENTLTQKLDYELALSHEMTRKCSLLSYLIEVSVSGSKILELQDEINQMSLD
ncbi:MAG: hypothetical protein MHPSP_002944, partial [Paramarteilia canceri]